MEWLPLLYEILQVCIIPLLGVLTAYIVKFINIKSAEIQTNVDNDMADKYIAMVTETISACVIATNQTYVNTLKGQNAFDAANGNASQAYNNPLQIPTGDQIGNAGLPESPTHGLLGSFAGTALLGANSNIVGKTGSGTIDGTTAHYSSIDKTNTQATDTIFLGPQLFQDNTSITSVDLSGSNIQALGLNVF